MNDDCMYKDVDVDVDVGIHTHNNDANVGTDSLCPHTTEWLYVQEREYGDIYTYNEEANVGKTIGTPINLVLQRNVHNETVIYITYVRWMMEIW